MKKRHCPPASLLDGAQQPAASGPTPREPPGARRQRAPGRAGRGRGTGGSLSQPGRSAARGAVRKVRGENERRQHPKERPLAPVHTHPARRARGRGEPLGALIPWRLLSRVPAPLGSGPGRRGPRKCPSRAWWRSGCSPGTSVKAGVRRRGWGSSAQGPPRSRTQRGGRSTQGLGRRRPVGARAEVAAGVGHPSGSLGRRSGEASAGAAGRGGAQPRAGARGGGAGRACRAAGAPFGRTLPSRGLRAAAAAASTAAAAAGSHGGSARPGPPPLPPAAG